MYRPFAFTFHLAFVAISLVGIYVGIVARRPLIEQAARSIDDAKLENIPTKAARTQRRIEPSTSEFEKYHATTSSNFGHAPGFGRHRGGTHILSGEDAVQFITDPINLTQAATDTETYNPYGPWGQLGSTARTNKTPLNQATPEHQGGFANLSWNAAEKAFPWTLSDIQLLSVSLSRVFLIDDNTAILTEHAEDTPHRKLDDFETEALAQLRDGVNVVVRAIPLYARMVGALRNHDHCMRCHDGDGILLGAFTYRFELCDVPQQNEPRVSKIDVMLRTDK